MHGHRIYLFLIVVLLALTPAADASLETATLDAILQRAGLNKDDLGMLIEDEKGPVFAINPDRTFIPASLTKIITAAASLEMFGDGYVFKTQMYSEKPVDNGVLDGSIYLKGGGDPSFNSRKLTYLLKHLQKHKIKKINGDIIIDDSRFDDARVDSWNTVKGLIQSWNLHGYPLFVNLDPPREYSPFVKLWKKAEKGLRTMLVSRKRDFVVYKNMTEPDLWTGMRMARMLKESRVAVTGKVKRGEVPADAELLGELTSPVDVVVKEMLKSSNNYMAEILTKNLAAEGGASPVTIEAGIELLRGYLQHIGVAREDYELTSAAGFSRLNAISPETVCYILNYLNDSAVSESFRASLPVAGVDGTLRYRMRKTAAQGRVVAKTGYLFGAVGLAGYVNRTDGKQLTFAFMYNGKKSSTAVKNAFDRICAELPGRRDSRNVFSPTD